MTYYISTPSGWRRIYTGAESLVLKREGVIADTTPMNTHTLTFSKTADKTHLSVKGSVRDGDPACSYIMSLAGKRGRYAESKVLFYSDADRLGDGSYKAAKCTVIVTVPVRRNNLGDYDSYEAELLFTGETVDTVFMPQSGTYGYEV